MTAYRRKEVGKWIRAIGKRQAEAVFQVRITDKENSSRSLHQVEDASVERVVTEVLTSHLPVELVERFGVKVLVEMRGKPRYGSITMFFAAIVTGYVLVSRYKSFNESIGLIRQQADDLLKNALRRFGRYNVNVEAVYPRYVHPEEFFFGRRHSPFSPWADEFAESTVAHVRRDGFFWFLLVLCILETAAIAALVYSAVSRVYFGP